MSPIISNLSDAAKARLLLIVLCLGWGTTWVTMRMALEEIPPFSMRVATLSLGAFVLTSFARFQGRKLAIPQPAHLDPHLHGVAVQHRRVQRVHAVRAIAAETSRVAIMVYTMPIWAAMLALPILGERLTPTRMVALGLCIAGMSILIAPLAGLGIPTRHHAGARRRDELGRRHRLPEMGEARRRPDGDHDLAAGVRRCRDRDLRAAVRRRRCISMPARGRCSG